MQEEFTCRKAGTEDLQAVSRFRMDNFPHDSETRSHAPEYYGWKCFNNPVMKGEIWLAESEGEIVGVKSLTPKKISTPQGTIIAAETGDTFTHPRYQRRGIFTSLFAAAGESGLDNQVRFVYGTPNRNSMPAYTGRLGYSVLPVDLRALVKPVYPHSYLEKLFHSACIASMLSSIIKLFSRLLLNLRSLTSGDIHITVASGQDFPDDMDSFWEQIDKEKQVCLVRDRAYLTWRYIDNPDTYTVLTARSKDGTLSGYLVTKTVSPEGKMTGYIADYMVTGNDMKVFNALMARALKVFLDEKVQFIHTWAVKGSPYYRPLLAAGCIPYNRIPLVYKVNGAGDDSSDFEGNWHLTMGDTDSI
ncbi:MAG: GNAT family N-acetyltransferase [Dehalococcoidales bacterium]|nr:GNAT family N-acetyltransferase [Dehalococcoidales bacterium]